MTVCANQSKNQGVFHNFIDKQPVGLNVAFPHVLIIPRICQGMIFVFFRQGLFVDKKRKDMLKLSGITASFDSEFIVFFKLAGKLDLKY